MKKKLLTILLVTILASSMLGSAVTYAETDEKKAAEEAAAAAEKHKQELIDQEVYGDATATKEYEEAKEEAYKEALIKAGFKDTPEGREKYEIKKAELQAASDKASQTKIDKEHTDLKNMTFSVGSILNTEETTQTYFTDKRDNPIVSLILRIIDFATTIMGSIAIIILIVAGFMLMFAQGQQQQLDEAKEVIKYALIGLALTFFSYIITIFIQSMFIS